MIHKTFAVDALPDLDVRIESGRLEIHEGEPGQVDVTVDTRLTDFIVEQRGNSILVSSDRNAGWMSRGSSYVVIEAPAGSHLRANVASAPVTVDVELGKVEIKSASGDIDVLKAETLVVKTASGDLRVDTVERALRVSSASGDVRVASRADGSLAVSTASGDVDIEKSAAALDINSASGDAYIRHFTGRSATFRSMSGNVDFGIPSGTTVDLDVSTLSGKVRLPEPEPRRGDAERHMSIRAKLVSGDFTIERA